MDNLKRVYSATLQKEVQNERIIRSRYYLYFFKSSKKEEIKNNYFRGIKKTEGRKKHALYLKILCRGSIIVIHLHNFKD